MEDVLDVYHLPYNEMRPVVCFDETSKQLVDHVRKPIPPRPGTAARVDDEYKREGTVNIFAAIEPITGRALVEVTERRTNVDTARFLKRLSDEIYGAAQTIVLVMDNLSTHSIACLYDAFPAAEARRIAKRFEIHHTPKHGSWLDVAEIFLSTMTIECLDQRVPDIQSLRTLVDAWMRSRTSGKVKWRFKAEDARIKLHRLYPSLP
jgi:DDE superfamily endonuclease